MSETEPTAETLADTNAEPTPAPHIPGTLVLGGRTFVVRKPSIEDYGAMLKEMRRQVQATAADPLTLANERIAAAERDGRPFSPTVVSALVGSALAASCSADAKPEPTQDMLAARMQTADGIRWWAWYLVRKADPAVTAKQVADWMPDDATAFRVAGQIGRLAG